MVGPLLMVSSALKYASKYGKDLEGPTKALYVWPEYIPEQSHRHRSHLDQFKSPEESQHKGGSKM